jgi:hypothetical protein
LHVDQTNSGRQAFENAANRRRNHDAKTLPSLSPDSL